MPCGGRQWPRRSKLSRAKRPRHRRALAIVILLPELNSPGHVLIYGKPRGCFGQSANGRGRRTGHRYAGNSICRRDAGCWRIVYRETDAASGHPSRASRFDAMTIEYRQFEYALVQGIGGHLWKWSASIAGEGVTGEAHTKAAAIAAAVKAIDRALAVKKVRLVPPAPIDAPNLPGRLQLRQ